MSPTAANATLRAVRRDDGSNDTESLTRRGRIEIPFAARVAAGGAGHLHSCLEGNSLRGASFERTLANLAVGNIVEVIGRGPGDAEGEGVFVAGDRFTIDFEPAGAPGCAVINDLSAWAPRRRIDRSESSRYALFMPVGYVDCPDRVAAFAGGGESNLLVIGRPCRHAVFRGIVGDAFQFPGPQIERPDVVAAA